ncbi:MAG: CDP-glycerol glycerophosphotransferase family protein [Mogibacterium sp.]|nr:CDP-glycerol glycerophosphotransferase family protein [Mogibacterium sp.]
MSKSLLTIMLYGTDREQITKTLSSIHTSDPVEIVLTDAMPEGFAVAEPAVLYSVPAGEWEGKTPGDYLQILVEGDCFYRDSLRKVCDHLRSSEYDVVTYSLLPEGNTVEMIENSYSKPNDQEFCETDYGLLPMYVRKGCFRSSYIDWDTLEDNSDYSYGAEILCYVFSGKRKCVFINDAVVTNSESRDLIEYEHLDGLPRLLEKALERDSLSKSEQYYILTVFSLMLKKPAVRHRTEVLDEEQQESLMADIRKIFQLIDLDVILSNENLILQYQNYYLTLKYGEEYIRERTLRNPEEGDAELVYRGHNILTITTPGLFKFIVLESRNNVLILDGINALGFLQDRYTVIAEDAAGKTWHPQVNNWMLEDRIGFIDEKVRGGTKFRFEIPITPETKQISFYLVGSDGSRYQLAPSFGMFGKIVKRFKPSYYAKGDYIFRYQKKGISVVSNQTKTHLKMELRYLKFLFSEKKYSMIRMRLAYYWRKRKQKKPLWLIRDNEDRAKDSGAEMFKYYSGSDELKQYADAEFILDKSSEDHPMMKQYGKVIQPYTYEYKLKHLLCDKLIDTRGGINAKYVFGEDYNYVADLCDWDYIWLIHGIMTRNESSWTNRFVLNAKLFATCNEREYASVLDEENGYGYTAKEVKLTGLPRHDALMDNRQKKVLFMPTWRQHLGGKLIPGTSEREYVEGFRENEFCQFYNGLINDPRLLAAMKEYGYTGDFCLHPSFMKQRGDFDGNDLIRIGDGPANANKMIGECAILITDYSSAQFEACYLDRPVVYPQYDADTFSDLHTGNEGYFDYEKDGFGPVCYNLEDTVDAIVGYLRDDCRNPEPYHTRAKDFFRFRDRSNAQRVYAEILKIGNQR